MWGALLPNSRSSLSLGFPFSFCHSLQSLDFARASLPTAGAEQNHFNSLEIPSSTRSGRLLQHILWNSSRVELPGAVHRSLWKIPGWMRRDLGLFGFPGNRWEGVAEFYKCLKILWDKGGRVWSRVGNGKIHNEEDVETTQIQSLENSTQSARGSIPEVWKSLGILLGQHPIPIPDPASHP